ncbi:MAG: GGDEF domain-containing protein [Bacteriovorax sp.]|nr:GGDEF domain-containing protein [Rhizobacter sp.]
MLHLLLPLGFLVAQGGLFALLPATSGPAAYLLMVAAPLLAGAAVLRRGVIEDGAARIGWFALALALAIWAGGAFGNYWEDVIKGRQYEMHRSSMLAFNLAVVPITFLLASGWGGTGRHLARAIDALLAAALGYAYFLLTWSLLTAHGAPDAAGVAAMLWLTDAQNLVLAAGALIRWRAAGDAKERLLFRTVAGYPVGYLLIAFVNNHYVAADPSFGAQETSIVTVVFALVAALALRPGRPSAAPRRASRLARVVHGASPLFLAGTLLIVSLLLIQVDYAFGAAGILIAVLGYGLRNTATQVRSIAREDRLHRDRSALRAIAWTDALTGVANRRFFDQAMATAARRSLGASQSLSVLMIDIDHFKLLNDRYGHPAGDVCLREVARALREALARPGDLLARYGGEEFIALLHDADADGAAVVAERLRAAVQALELENPGSPLGSVSVSVGTASGVLLGDAAAARLVHAADQALYAAKCAGRNRVRAAAMFGA